jgi:hypothetical protein
MASEVRQEFWTEKIHPAPIMAWLNKYMEDHRKFGGMKRNQMKAKIFKATQGATFKPH